MIAHYMMDIYSENKEMTGLLEKLFEEHPIVCFSKLTDRSIISALNRFQTCYPVDGYRLYDYIENGVLEFYNFICEFYNFIIGYV